MNIHTLTHCGFRTDARLSPVPSPKERTANARSAPTSGGARRFVDAPLDCDASPGARSAGSALASRNAGAARSLVGLAARRFLMVRLVYFVVYPFTQRPFRLYACLLRARSLALVRSTRAGFRRARFPSFLSFSLRTFCCFFRRVFRCSRVSFGRGAYCGNSRLSSICPAERCVRSRYCCERASEMASRSSHSWYVSERRGELGRDGMSRAVLARGSRTRQNGVKMSRRVRFKGVASRFSHAREQV